MYSIQVGSWRDSAGGHTCTLGSACICHHDWAESEQLPLHCRIPAVLSSSAHRVCPRVGWRQAESMWMAVWAGGSVGVQGSGW